MNEIEEEIYFSFLLEIQKSYFVHEKKKQIELAHDFLNLIKKRMEIRGEN